MTRAGKPYGFEFDFATSDKLVCTELVYQCYGSLLDSDCPPGRPGEQLPQIMGWAALPALEFCDKFTRERSSPDRELDLVLSLDAIAAQRVAREADASAFSESASRPRGSLSEAVRVTSGITRPIGRTARSTPRRRS